MSRIDHNRPYLRWLDSIRKQLPNQVEYRSGIVLDASWPPCLQPVVAKPAALKALFHLLELIDSWLENETAEISISNPPEKLKAAYRAFARARVYNRYDSAFCGRDWLQERGASLDEDGDIRSALRAMFQLLFGDVSS